VKKYFKIVSIIILVISLFSLLGCSVNDEDNVDYESQYDVLKEMLDEKILAKKNLDVIIEISEPQVINGNLDFVVAPISYEPVVIEEPFPYSPPEYFDPYIVSIETYEEYRSIYPTCNNYDEEFFEMNGIIEYYGIITNNGSDHKIISLEYENNILTLNVEARGSEIILCGMWYNYPRPASYSIEYVKPEIVEEVILNFRLRNFRDYHYLDKVEDVEKLRVRIEADDYIDVLIEIGFNFDNWVEEERESYINEKIDQYNLSEISDQIKCLYYMKAIYIDIDKVDNELVDRLLLMLSDQELSYLYVGLQNYDLNDIHN